jgi:hypothetical protein
VRSRNPSIRRRSILRTGNVSSTSHIDHLSSASLTATKPFIAITWGCHERCDHVAVPIAEDYDLVAFELLVTAEAEVIAAFLGRCGRAIALDDGDVQAIVLMKFEHRAFENGIKASVCLPSPKGAIDAN